MRKPAARLQQLLLKKLRKQMGNAISLTRYIRRYQKCTANENQNTEGHVVNGRRFCEKHSNLKVLNLLL